MEKQTGLLKVLWFFLGCSFAMQVFGQEINVTGKVTDASDGMPLPGVTVVVKSTARGTITSPDGAFNLRANVGEELVFSFIGYANKQILIENSEPIKVKLAADVIGMDEVVVIGYGQVKKGDATGSVATVGADDFNAGAITSPQELLVGKTPGVVITTNDGAPGAGSKIRIRGGSSLNASNDPLIVIDGFPIDNVEISGMSNNLSTINPNDIESMTILKDASATAIYGSRASNGVIIITTKKGKKDGLHVSYNGNVSVGVPVEYTEVLSGDEFRAVVQDRVANHGLTAVALEKLGAEGTNTDWQDKIYRTSVSTDHNISLHGKYAKVPYRVSIGHTLENGILKENGLQRTTGAIKLNPSFLKDHLKVSIDLKGMDIHNDFSNTDAVGRAFAFDPTQTEKSASPAANEPDNTGAFGWNDGYTSWLGKDEQGVYRPINIATHNPVASLEYRDNQSDVQRFIANIQVDYKLPFFPDLRANLSAGYDYSDSDGTDHTDSNASWSLREPESNYHTYTHKVKNSLFDFYLNYTKDLVLHRFDVTAGYGYQHFHRDKLDYYRPWQKVDGVYKDARSDPEKNENFLVSFFGRLNYTLKDRYLVTATLRNDGSSRFSEDNRWGLFPSFSFAWKVKKEPFLASFKAMNDLKLRVGYGITGQQDIGDQYYPYIPVYESSKKGAYYQMGDEFYSTLRANRYDPDIKWEETTTYNVGVDFGFFNSRLSGSFDYYKRETEDLISEIPIAAGTNFSNYLYTNVGTLENSGFEIALNYRVISQVDMSWEIGANLTRNVNEITSLTKAGTKNDNPGYDTGDIAGGTDNKVMRNTVGYATNTFNLFKQVYDSSGMPIEGLYVDKTGQGGDVAGNNDNKYLSKDPAPDYLIGITSRFAYKNFDFSFAGRISVGNYVYNNNNSNRALYQNIYSQAGYLSNVPSAITETNFSTAQYWSDIYLEDASFFRMDNISVGYSFNKLFSEKLSGRVSGTVQNAFVITDYSGLDPEVEDGIDDNIYPRPRTYMLGVTINF